MYRKVAVTGAGGHIGNVVCRMLVAKGYSVKALYHTSRIALENLPVEVVRGDVLNKDDLSQLIEGCEVVIHCAALITIHGDPTGMVFRTNTEGPKNVVEVCKKKNIKKLIHISSVHAVSEIPLSEPFDENRPYKTEKDPVYDYSKALGEQLVKEHSRDSSLEVIILRPSSVVGPFDFKPSEMGKALLDFYHKRIPALPQGGYDFVDVRDVAASIIEAVEKGKGGEIYILSGKYYTLKELVKIIGRVTGIRMPGVVIPYRILTVLLPLISCYSKITGAAPLFTRESIDVLRYGHPRMDAAKARRDLNHTCRPMEETISDHYSSYFKLI